MRPQHISTGLLLVLTLGIWSGASQCAVFTDSLGRQVSVDRVPGRIVTLAPSLTEIVFFLGLGDRLVGVTEFSSYPPEASEKPKVGSYVNLNVEKIISLSPDLVIGTVDGNQASVVALLERAGVPVYIVNPRDIRQAIDTVVAVGELCGVRELAATMAQGLSDRVDEIVSKTAGLEKPVVFLQVNLKPIMSVNRNTFLDDLIHLAGGVNMTRDEPMNYPRISLEEVISRRPDVILVSSMARGGGFARAKRQWMRWTLIPAVQNGRVHLVDSDLIDRPSPRIIEGLEVVARLLHPDAQWTHPAIEGTPTGTVNQ